MPIGTLAYKITADTQKFDKSIKATRSEMRAAKQIMEQTVPASDKLEAGLKGLERLYQKGLIDIKSYTRAINKLEGEFRETGAAADKTAVSQKKLNGASTGLLSITKSLLGPLGLSAASFYSLGAAVRSIRGELKELDQLAKASAKLGIDPNDLRAFGIAADRAGIGSKTLETSLQRMVRKVGDANRGVGEATKIFNELGLDFTKLAELSPEKQFLVVAERIAGMNTHAEKLSATVKIFDSEGAEMVRLLDLGADGFARVSVEAEKYFGSIDDNLGQSEKLNDQLARMELQLKALKQGAALATAESTTGFGRLGDKINISAGDVGRFTAELFIGSTGLDKFTKAADIAAEAAERIIPDGMAEDVKRVADEIRAATADASADLFEPQGLAAGTDAVGLMGVGFASLTDQIANAAKAAGDLKKETEKMGKSAESIIKRNQTPLEKYLSQLYEATRLRDSGLLDAGQFGREQARLDAELKKATETKATKADPAREIRFAGAAQAGSQEAFAAIAQARAGFQTRGADAEAPKHTTLLARIAENTKPMPVVREETGPIV